MDTKILLTKTFLEALDLPTDDKTVSAYLPLWWKNPRLQGERSFALTSLGFDVISGQVGLHFYQLDLPVDLKITNQLLIWLDRYIDCPYFLTKKAIFVSKEKMAVQLVLFGGDLVKFGRAKSNSK